MRSSLLLLMVTLATACADPCGFEEPPSLTIGGSDEAGNTFEAYADGAERDLVIGPQLGMHVWLHVRFSNICPDMAIVERRVTNADGELLELGRGVPALVDGPDVNSFELQAPVAMFICPTTDDVTPVGQVLTLEVSATADGRIASAMTTFVPRCPPGTDCATFCDP